MRILDRYILKEVFITWLGITTILLVVTIGLFFGNTLGDVARGRVPANLLFSTLGLSSVEALTVLLPLSLFLAVMLALSRFYRDSEMAVFSSFGLSPLDIYRPLLRLALPGSLLLLVLATWVSPWAVRTSKTMISDATRSVTVAGLMAGQFHQIAANDGVVYVETLSEDGVSFTNAFIHTEQDGRKDVVTASHGYQYQDEVSGARFLALIDGSRSEGVPGQADYRWMKFARNDVRLPDLDDRSGPVLKINALTLEALAVQPENARWAEWHWRLAPAIAALVLSFLAVPLSRTTPRKGFYGNLIVAILAYVIYANLLAIGKSWLEKGDLPGLAGLWWAHGGLVVIAAFMLRNRMPRSGRTSAVKPS